MSRTWVGKQERTTTAIRDCFFDSILAAESVLHGSGGGGGEGGETGSVVVDEQLSVATTV